MTELLLAVALTTATYTVRSTVGPLETPLTPAWADFLLDHPDLSASLVRKYKIAPYKITMRGPRQSLADDGDGTKGLVTLVDHDGPRRLYYGEGTHDSRVFPTIHAAAVIEMDVQPVRRPECPDRIKSSFTVFVKLRNPLLSGMVKVLRPFVRDTVIRKFSRAFLVAHQVGTLLAQKPDEVEAAMLSYEGLTDADRAELRALIAEGQKKWPRCGAI